MRADKRNQVDVFGTLRCGETEARVRLMSLDGGRLAAFEAADPTSPHLFELEGDIHVKGRILTAQTQYGELKFQKAGCGCETPRELRVSRTLLLQGAGLAGEPAPPETP